MSKHLLLSDVISEPLPVDEIVKENSPLSLILIGVAVAAIIAIAVFVIIKIVKKNKK